MRLQHSSLLFHDTFLMRGGAERMNLLIADILDADIAVAYVSPKSFDPAKGGRRIFITNPNFRRGGFGFLRMKWSFFWSTFVQEYDRVFFSNEAITAIRNVKPGTKTYYYAHSISRHLFDQKEEYYEKMKWYKKPFFFILSLLLKYSYIHDVRRADVIFVNSLSNQKRMKEWIGRDSTVLYPPVDTEVFRPLSLEEWKNALEVRGTEKEDPETSSGGQIQKLDSVQNLSFPPRQESEGIESFLAIYNEDPEISSGGHDVNSETTSECHILPFPYKSYYISFARLTHAKRIDRIIESAKHLPEKNFLILYGEEDSQKDEFIALGKGYPNIHFHTLTDNSLLPRVISGAIASIAVSREEDFGMVAIESMACGVPVIAVDEGGYRESIIHGATGILIPTQGGDFEKQDLEKAIEKMTPEYAVSLKDSCRERANDFSLVRFREKLGEFM